MKRFIIFSLLLLSLSGAVAFAAEEYKASTYVDISSQNIQNMNSLYNLINIYMGRAIASSGRRYVKFEDVLNKLIKASFDVSSHSNFVLFKATKIEMKYTKLKNNCSPLPSNPKDIKPERACGELLFDADGFSKGSNKLFRDKKTLQAKDQFILYLFANGVRPAYLSPEDVILMTSPDF